MFGVGGTDSLTGNAGNDALYGGDGNDVISGGAGNEVLEGGPGHDTLNGGDGNDQLFGGDDSDALVGGADFFVFVGVSAQANGADRITDFEAGSDSILLNVNWSGDFAAGAIIASRFISRAGRITAVTAQQRIVYDTFAGKVYFDVDGHGGTASVLLVSLTNPAVLTRDHIFAEAPF